MHRRFNQLLKLLKGNAADQIFELVREQILTGKYRRGAKLPTEKAFSATYGVSGVTIRSAMRSLAAAGLIEVKQGSGSYVTAHSDQLLAGLLRSMIQGNSTTPTEILTTLGGMNGFAAELAAPIIRENDLERMQTALDDISTRQTVDEISDGLKRFLHLLADASGNALLAAFCKYLSALQISLAWEISDGTLKGWQQVTWTSATTMRSLKPRSNPVTTAVYCGQPLRQSSWTRCRPSLPASRLARVRAVNPARGSPDGDLAHHRVPCNLTVVWRVESENPYACLHRKPERIAGSGASRGRVEACG